MQLFRESTPDSELGVTAGPDDVRAFQEGGVGWAAGRGYFEMEGKRVPVRFTAVLHQEDGEWKSGAGPRVDWCAQRPDARRHVPGRGLAPQSPFR